jgi:5-methylcytosine-specific restriction endonuclease McrA
MGKHKSQITFDKFIAGKVSNKGLLRKCLLKSKEYVCSLCGNRGVHRDIKLTLQVDHIDGNPDNNLLENLRWLCPNCHSQTDTYAFKGKTHKDDKRNIY